MNALKKFAATLAGLFVDDGSLAIAILLILAGVALAARMAWIGPSALGALLAGAVLGALLENVVRAARHFIRDRQAPRRNAVAAPEPSNTPSIHRSDP